MIKFLLVFILGGLVFSMFFTKKKKKKEFRGGLKDKYLNEEK